MWILVALISPLFHGVANILDNYLSNKLFKNVWTLIFFSSCFNIIFVPIIFLVEKPNFPPLHLLPPLIIIAVIEILYLYPYYKALQNEDTSVVASLFALGKIFVPLLAFLVVGEVLKTQQYLGFLIIILSSALLTVKKGVRIYRSKSLFFMAICTLLLALEGVLYKYVFNEVSWSTGFFWPSIFTLPFVLGLLLTKRLRDDIKRNFFEFKRTFVIFLMEEFLTFGGLAASSYAISLVPVTFEKSIDSFQPFFTLVSAMAFSKISPKFFKETTDRKSIIKKVLLFSVMVLGTLLVVR